MNKMMYYFDRKKTLEEEKKKIEEKYNNKCIIKNDGRIYLQREGGKLIFVKKVAF